MQEIPLTRGFVALVDDEDYPLISQYKWHVHILKNRKEGFNVKCAETTIRKPDGRQSVVTMHKMVFGSPGVDHKDGNPLNNQKENLRAANCSQNNRNRRTPSHNTSGYKGVSLQKRTQKWQAQIKVDAKMRWLGSYESREEAAKAYNDAARRFFGEFARLNVI